ncbi:MAG: hypothetical protein ABUL46_02500 [Chitinophaga rupis]
MKIQELIASGILESYALGLASPEETAELERLLPLHPPLQDALLDFEYRLESFAIQHEVPPPPRIREKIEARLREVPAVRPVYRRNGPKEQAFDYIPIETSSPYIWVHKNWRTWFFIFCIMSKIFLALFIYYFVQYQHAQKENLQLQEKISTISGSTAAPGK